MTVVGGSELWVDAAVLHASDQNAVATDTLRERASTYGGELLPGFYDEWVILERERLKGMFERTMQQLLERLVDERLWADVSEWGDQLTSPDRNATSAATNTAPVKMTASGTMPPATLAYQPEMPPRAKPSISA